MKKLDDLIKRKRKLKDERSSKEAEMEGWEKLLEQELTFYETPGCHKSKIVVPTGFTNSNEDRLFGISNWQGQTVHFSREEFENLINYIKANL